jgi:phosphoribosylamine--glycine ligase
MSNSNRILIVGGGGREHALAIAIRESSHATEVFVAPGNAGTASIARNHPVALSDIDALEDLALAIDPDLVIVGPEVPLVLGLSDVLRARGMRVVGPSAAAARLEGSKAFAKDFMSRHGIPTASFRTFAADRYEEARACLEEGPERVVVKASGLAAGKGAIVCLSREEAIHALDLIARDRAFGDAGAEVVIEEYMEGEEASVFALCDGQDYVLLATAQDHKQVGEGDTGPNTGGMGAYAPAPILGDRMLATVEESIIRPTIRGMAQDGCPFSGFLYVGLMISSSGPRVVEYNCRLGDPEAQVVLPLIRSDLLGLFTAAADESLSEYRIDSHPGSAACVVLCSRGYPGEYSKGHVVEGLGEAAAVPGVTVVHAGTQNRDGTVVTSGGRVLGVVATGRDLAEALEAAYSAARLIKFEGVFFRSDIGSKGLK